MSETVVKIIGLVAGACTSCAIIPQVITTYKKKKASDVSIAMFIVLLTGNVLWIYYGVSKKEIPIIITNAFTVLLNVAMLILKIRYKKNE